MKSKTVVEVGVDVSSDKLDLAVSGPKGVWERELPNTPSGFQALIKRVGKKARVCMEATGVYHLALAMALHRAGLEVMVVNPRAIKDHARALQKRSKTDRVDARTILDFLQRMEFVAWNPPTQELVELRSIARHVGSLIELQSAERSRLHAARTSNQSRLVIREIEGTIRHLNQRVTKAEKAAIELIKASEDLSACFDRLNTAKGIAARTAIAILGELGVLDESLTSRQVVAHAGLDPRHDESGHAVRPTRISRQGNARLRALLYMPALTLIRRDRNARAFYEKLLSRGKAKMQAIVAVMRKMLHALWVLMHRDVSFDSSILFPVEAEALAASAKAPALAVAALQPEGETAHPGGRSEAEQRVALEPDRLEACASA